MMTRRGLLLQLVDRRMEAATERERIRQSAELRERWEALYDAMEVFAGEQRRLLGVGWPDRQARAVMRAFEALVRCDGWLSKPR